MVGWRSGLLLVVIVAGGCGGDSSSVVPSPTSVPGVDSVSTTVETVSDSGVVEEPSGARPEAVEDTEDAPPAADMEDATPIEDAPDLELEEAVEAEDSESVEDAPTVPDVEDAEDVEQPEEPTRVVAEFWRHGLEAEALDLIDPWSVDADEWGKRRENFGNREQIFYMFFWFQDPEGDIDAEVEALSGALNIVRSKLELSSTIYRPVRYDLRWAEYPVEASVIGYYPLGEKRILNTSFDGRLWKADTTVYTPSDSTDAGVGGAIPPGPPIRPTTPFAEPRWPDTAQALGRDCAPVEELWPGNAAPVTDQCTLDAIDTALQYAWSSPSELRQRAIRDGHVLTDLFTRFDSLDEINPFLTAWYGEEGRSRITVNVRDMRWAGNWPGASMIYLEYQLAWADREMTDEERQGGIHFYTLAAERGYGRPELLRGEFDLANDRFYDSALMVRAADGTWGLSYRTFCRFAEIIITLEQPRYLCPDDPNPHFPDSPIYDKNIYSPKNPRYYSDPREKAPNTPLHDGGTPRDNTIYVGVPPS